MYTRCFPSSSLSNKSNNRIKRLTSRSLAGLALAVGLVAALVALALSLSVKAVVGVSSLVAQVGVDADKLQKSPSQRTVSNIESNCTLRPRTSPPFFAMTPVMLTLREHLLLPLQLPHER